jgi:hypothetical protein
MVHNRILRRQMRRCERFGCADLRSPIGGSPQAQAGAQRPQAVNRSGSMYHLLRQQSHGYRTSDPEGDAVSRVHIVSARTCGRRAWPGGQQGGSPIPPCHDHGDLLEMGRRATEKGHDPPFGSKRSPPPGPPAVQTQPAGKCGSRCSQFSASRVAADKGWSRWSRIRRIAA